MIEQRMLCVMADYSSVNHFLQLTVLTVNLSFTLFYVHNYCMVRIIESSHSVTVLCSAQLISAVSSNINTRFHRLSDSACQTLILKINNASYSLIRCLYFYFHFFHFLVTLFLKSLLYCCQTLR